MSGDQRASSSGDAPNAQPPTPKQTPTSAVFPSPVFETPKVTQGSFVDSSGWTPNFAEQYSVFNSTPGNLRGADSPFFDHSLGPSQSANGHKRLLSAEGFPVDIAAHANNLSLNPNLPFPPVDPSRRLPSSPGPLNVPPEYPGENPTQLSPSYPNPHSQSAKKARRGTASDTETLTQTATPPPTSHRGERRLAPKLTMQNDQGFNQPDFSAVSQQQEMAALMASNDMFTAGPLSAPAMSTTSFWGSADASMGMDLDWGVPGPNVFQQPVANDRQMGSWDWNNDQFFQDTSMPMPLPNQENIQPGRRERVLAPKPPVSSQGTAAATAAMTAAFSAPSPMDDPFGLMNTGGEVDPRMIFSRPQSSAMDMSFNAMAQTGSAEAAIAESGSRSAIGGDLRRSTSFHEVKNSKVPDRGSAGSPVKSRPGMGRSVSETRGKKTLGRSALPMLAPAVRPMPQNGNGSPDGGRTTGRTGGRSSPLKSQHRLASIPESLPQPPPRTSVRLFIDERGRARTETTVMGNEREQDGNMKGRSSRETSQKGRLEIDDDDDSSTDDEPIIIPSRNTSFNASFALPDPRKPVGSIFHPSKRSASRSSSTLDGPCGSQQDNESEAETVMDYEDSSGNAVNEVLKLVVDRKRSHQNARSQRFLQTNLSNFHGNSQTVSPSSLTDSSSATDRRDIRCICNRVGLDGDDGYMIQCDSCEGWFHGKCNNVDKVTRSRIWLCPSCTRTPDPVNNRIRDGIAGKSTASPLSNKSFRSFR